MKDMKKNKKYIYSFSELLAEKDDDFRKNYINLIGSKAVSLIELIHVGLNVPDGYFLSVDAFYDFLDVNNILILKDKKLEVEVLNKIRNKIQNGIVSEDMKEQILSVISSNSESRFAIRSSGINEDLQGASFAGQYETFLNIPSSEEMIDYIVSCWASAFSETVYNYNLSCNSLNFDPGMGVIIQKMVSSEKSGVVFTVDPVTGLDKEFLIEACFGLGSSLVDGVITPDQYKYNWYEEIETSRVINEKKFANVSSIEKPYTISKALDESESRLAVLDENEVIQLCFQCLIIQEYYGFPVDIEWGKTGTTFSILQSRPITGIHTSGIKGQWSTADFRDGGVSSDVCSAFMWSLYDYTWERSTEIYLKKNHMGGNTPGIQWGEMFYSKPYWNVTAIKDGLKNIPGFVEREFDEDLGIQVAYEGKGYVTKISISSIIQGLKVIIALGKSFKERIIENSKFTQTQERRFEALDGVDPEKMAEREFYKFYESLITEDYFFVESNYFYNIFNNSNAQTLFREKFAKIKTDIDILELMSGLTGISHLKPNFELWDISRSILNDSKRHENWNNNSIDGLNKMWKCGELERSDLDVVDYINRHGYHSTRELDITVENFWENPEFIFWNLKSFLKMADDQNPEKHVEKQNQAFKEKKAIFLKNVPFYKRKSLEIELEQCRKLLWWREELRDYSTRMYDYIRRFTIHMSGMFIKKGIYTDINDIFHLKFQEIIDFSKGILGESDLLKNISRNKHYYASFKNYKNPWDIGTGYEKFSEDMSGKKSYKGVPSSPGTVTGQVRLVMDIYETDRIEKGDILVTRFTDPGWTPVFNLLSGVITETGGVLSHAAVISREYGLPAVLAVDGITDYLHDGQTVTIDGTNGMIYVEDEE